jgi:small-conductance mechanosensitive channel
MDTPSSSGPETPSLAARETPPVVQETPTTQAPPEASDDVSAVVAETTRELVADLVATVPRLVAGVLFLVVAAVVVWVVRRVVGLVVARAFPDEAVYQSFVTTLAGVVLWFAVALAFLSVVGLEEIAAALGTASGFLALGVSYALSGMIADAVAGVYLLRDPDFEVGDEVTAGDTTGEVAAIELRKTRIDVDGDTVVRANAEIEKRWTKRDDADGPGE